MSNQVKVAQDSNFRVYFNVINNTKADFNASGFHTSSGQTKSIVPIVPNATTNNAYFGEGTSGTWTGLVGYGQWQCAVGFNKTATLTLNFDMPFDGDNTGSVVGNTAFNELFDLTLGQAMPSGGQVWTTTVTISMKEK